VFYIDGLSFLPDALLHLVISFMPHSYDCLNSVSKRFNRVVHQYNQFPRSLICGFPYFRTFPYELASPVESHYQNCLEDEIRLHGKYFFCSLPVTRLLTLSMFVDNNDDDDDDDDDDNDDDDDDDDLYW
jgi:hypothetical protein